MIVGWRTTTKMTADLVTDALDMAIFSRRRQLLHRVIAHCDVGSQYTSVAYTERLAELGPVPSIGTVSDTETVNALAETVNGCYTTELIRGPSKAHGRPSTCPRDVKGQQDLPVDDIGYGQWSLLIRRPQNCPLMAEFLFHNHLCSARWHRTDALSNMVRDHPGLNAPGFRNDRRFE